MRVRTALTNADRSWRVEIIERGQACWYRIVHGDNVIDWLPIAAVERLLVEAAIDMSDLVEVTDDPPPAGDRATA